jgi:predicted RNA methylase
MFASLQGMLAIGAALLGSQAVLGVDIDADALEVAQRNCDQFEEPLPVRAAATC